MDPENVIEAVGDGWAETVGREGQCEAEVAVQEGGCELSVRS